MQKSLKQKVVIIGCGNLAWHLAEHLSTIKKFEITVYNHQANKFLTEFKTKLACKIMVGLSKIDAGADYYFICVSDKHIASVSKKIKTDKIDTLIIHTSGSKGIDELNKHKNKAVFYPVQTFSKEAEVNWAEVPIAIEGNSKNSTNKIKVFATLFSKNVISLNSNDRLKLHLAAVLVNNFTNALYTSAEEFITSQIKNKTANFNLLLPIIKQTSEKLNKLSPLKAQTGPAKRKDKEVIKAHLKLLKNNKSLKKIYKQLSILIEEQQKM